MSLSTRIAPVATRTSLPLAGRKSVVVAAARPAFFSTTALREDRGPVEATKDTLKKADKAVSGAAVKGIETGEKASHKIKDKFTHESKKAGEEGEKAAKEAKQKANEVTEEAQRTAEEWTGKA